MIGQTISHYKIIEKIGEGGMAHVYKAEDSKLKRTVALKFISPHRLDKEQTKTRFIQEAQTAAGLNHPNITTIYEIDEIDDQTFIAMEYIEGTSLRDLVTPRPLSVGKSLNIALQIIEGLGEAHERKITHRDIKSSNIMITPRGQAKIMDFGLVKLEGGTQITKTSMVMGTVSYMSPEQAKSEDVDFRTDIWSFGVVLYEMLTGQLPFKGSHDQIILHSILKKRPEPLSTFREDIPLLFEDIIEKCLKKNPKDRYQSVSELKSDLEDLRREITTDHATLSLPGRLLPRIYRKPVVKIALPLLAAIVLLISLMLFTPVPQLLKNWINPPSAPSQKGLAVIPFTVRSNNPEDKEFCAGLIDFLINKLTKIQQYQGSFWVVPHREVRRENVESAVDARKAFNVDFVIDPTMQVAENKVYFIINLIDAESRRQLSSEILPYDVKDLSGIQEDLSQTTIAMLGIELPPEAQIELAKGGTENIEAFNLYIQGLGYLLRYERPENIDIAIGLFVRSIDKDSNYALAHAGLAEAYWQQWNQTKNSDFIRKAQDSCMEAIQISKDSAPIHITMGIIYRDTGQYEDALSEFKTALEYEPNNEKAYREMARTFQMMGDTQKAEEFYKTAIDLVPSFWGGYNHLGYFYYRTGQIDKAVSMFLKVIELTPDNARGYNNLGGSYASMGRLDLAEPILEKAIEIQPSGSNLNNLATVYFNQGKFTKAEEIYTRAITFVENNYVIWGNLGDSRRYTGKHTQAQIQKDYERAKNLVMDSLAVNSSDTYARSHLAFYHAILGDSSNAIKEISAVLKQEPKDVEILRKVIQVFELTGDRENALSACSRYLKNGGVLNYILVDPDFEDLKKDLRFRQLIKQVDPNK